ncbi:hypothetical protein [Deinococcus sp. 12RED42]|uniref:hypothetical protein n=1 Tax=Deinococcus sp. 12RED42 TaxID=2745872 RepID=UPI001E501080|nr:hypothetical protein [Deinococcus sp. 12RED42]MCD0164779.1 hypothetical protein [Deinococcus sp. 12RED42]
MSERNPLGALSQLKSLTRAVTERSVERLHEWTGTVPPQHRADADLAATISLTVEQADRLARTAHPTVQRLLAERTELAPSTLRLLALAESSDVHLMTAMHPQCPPDVLTTLALHPTTAVARAACLHAAVPTATLAQVAARTDTSPLVLAAIAQHPRTAPEVLEQLASRPHTEVLRSVARHPACPDAALALLARHTDEELLVGLAQRTALPDKVQATLARSRHTEVLLGLVSNPATTANVLEAVTQRLPIPPDLMWRIAIHPNTSPATLLRLARTDDPALRQVIVSRASVPVQVLGILADDPVPHVQDAAAHRLTDPRMKEELAQVTGWRDDLVLLEKVLGTLDREALEAATRRHEAWGVQADSSDLRRLRAGHEASVLQLKRDSLLRLERELGRLRREAHERTQRDRWTIQREVAESLKAELRRLEAEAQQERERHLTEERSLLTQQMQTARSTLRAESRQRFETEVRILHEQHARNLALDVEAVRVAGEASAIQALAALKAELEADLTVRRDTLMTHLATERTAALAALEAPYLAERQRVQDAHASLLSAMKEDLMLEAKQHLEQAQNERLLQQQRQLADLQTELTEVLRTEQATRRNAHQEATQQALAQQETLLVEELERRRVELLAEHEQILEQDQLLWEQEKVKLLGEAEARHQAQMQHLNQRMSTTLNERRQALARQLAQQEREWQAQVRFRFEQLSVAEEQRLDAELQADLEQYQQELQTQVDQTRQSVQQDLEAWWEERSQELQAEYHQWYRQESAELRLKADATHHELQSGAPEQRRTLEEQEQRRLANDHPHVQAARLIMQHGVMTEMDLLSTLTDLESPRRFRRTFASFLESHEVDGQAVILTEHAPDGSVRYLRNPLLPLSIRV